MFHRIHPQLVGSVVAAAILVVGSGAATAAQIQHLPLDGNANATVGTNGTLVGGPVAAPDRFGNASGAIQFDGVNDRVEVSGGGGLNNLETGTIALFVRWAGTQDSGGFVFGAVTARQNNTIFSNNVIALNGADPSTARIVWLPYTGGTNAVTSTFSPGNGVWRHIAVTFSSGAHQLYIDGQLNSTGTTTGNIDDNNTIPLTVGAWIDHGDSYSSSRIDDFRVYDTILSQAEIQAIPEPSALGVVAVAGVAATAFRRRRR